MAASAVAVSTTWCRTRSEIARSNGVARRRPGLQVERDGGDVGSVTGRQLLADDLAHALGRLGEHEVADVVGQREAEQPGPGADVDGAGRRRQRRRSPGSQRRPPRLARGVPACPIRVARSSNVAMAALPSLLRSRARRSPTSRPSAARSRPSGPSASTRAEATMTPSAPALAIARTCAGLLTPNPTATGTGETALTSLTRRPTEDGSDVRAPGHADERDAIQEAAASGGDGRAPGGWRGRGHEIDDREPGGTGHRLERRPFVRRQVGDDQPGRTRAGQALRHGLAVAATDDLVGVAHRHERKVGPGGADAFDQAEGALQRGAGRQGDPGRALERGAVGQRIRIREADLEQICPGIGGGQRGGEARVGIGVAGDDVRDERRAAVGTGAREGRCDPTRAGGLVRALGRARPQRRLVGRERPPSSRRPPVGGELLRRRPRPGAFDGLAQHLVGDTREVQVDPAVAPGVRRRTAPHPGTTP